MYYFFGLKRRRRRKTIPPPPKNKTKTHTSKICTLVRNCKLIRLTCTPVYRLLMCNTKSVSTGAGHYRHAVGLYRYRLFLFPSNFNSAVRVQFQTRLNKNES